MIAFEIGGSYRTEGGQVIGVTGRNCDLVQTVKDKVKRTHCLWTARTERGEQVEYFWDDNDRCGACWKEG